MEGIRGAKRRARSACGFKRVELDRRGCPNLDYGLSRESAYGSKDILCDTTWSETENRDQASSKRNGRESVLTMRSWGVIS
jgi:hypothetical protein